MQEQGRQKERQKEQEKKKSGLPGQSPSGQPVCPNCGHRNEDSANFCEECGNPLGAHICPNCKAPATPNQDICEVCGAWILTDQCKFCYAPISPEDAFCAECGNPAAGVTCPQCGTVNHFDFCKKCNHPLTEAALAEIEKCKKDSKLVELKAVLAEMEELEAEILESESVSEEELMRQRLEAEMEKEEQALREKFKEIRKAKENLKELLGDETPEKPREIVPDPPKPKPVVNSFSNMEEKRAQRDARRKELLLKIQTKLDELKERSFESPQAARRFFNASRPPGNYVWNCNYNDSIHPDPNNCGHPEDGGRWVIEFRNIEWETHHGEY